MMLASPAKYQNKVILQVPWYEYVEERLAGIHPGYGPGRILLTWASLFHACFFKDMIGLVLC
jgi:hypothetical protein